MLKVYTKPGSRASPQQMLECCSKLLVKPAHVVTNNVTLQLSESKTYSSTEL